MNGEIKASQFRANDLVKLTVSCHNDGYFVRDPSPSVLSTGETGIPIITDGHLEKRSLVDVPHRSLGQLWSLMHGQSDRVKLEAARHYMRMREISGLDLDGALRSHTETYIERCCHENRDFKVIPAGGMLWYVRRELFRESLLPILENPDPFLHPGPKMLKDGRSNTIARTPSATVLKRFNLKSYRRLLTGAFRPSRARRAYRRAYHLETVGVRTANAIAFGERRILGTVYRSYLLCEFIPESLEIHRALRFWEDGGFTDLKILALRNAGRLVGRLHSAGIANRDLKGRNILVTGRGEVWLIDLDGVRPGERVNDETRIKNLRRITRDLADPDLLTVRERLSFIRAYIRAVRRGEAKDLFRTLSAEPWS